MSGWDGYWEARKDLPYYKVVKRWLEEFGPMPSILDIGCGGCPTATWGTFEKRTAINLEDFTPIEGVECIVSDWLECKKQATIITCMQVLEHLTDETLVLFVNKIHSSCKTSIISVSYLWPHGAEEGHIQDPISVSKFMTMIGKDPIKLEISGSRIVGMFEGELQI